MNKRRTLQLSEGMTGTVIATILTTAPTSATRTGNTGSGTAHNNMQPSMALNWIVKI